MEDESVRASLKSTGGAKSLEQIIRQPEGYAKAPDTGLASILVVDDDREVCQFLERMLTQAGHQVEMCLSGQEAIARLMDRSFHLVIADLKMAGVDGLDVLRKAKELDPRCEVMVITAYASVESAVEAMKLGAHDYITKPFNIEEVRIVVDKALEKRALLQAVEERDFYKQLSLIDGLTEVYNYRAFYQMLEAELDRSKRHGHNLSLLMIDVDDLKIYNDTLGHPAADVLLKELAWMLKKLVRNCDIVARYGGDEFAIILVESKKVEAIDIANRLNRLVETTRFAHDEVFPHKTLTISVGAANYPTDATEMTELVTKADRALCEGKAQGGNAVKIA